METHPLCRALQACGFAQSKLSLYGHEEEPIPKAIEHELMDWLADQRSLLGGSTGARAEIG
jgi:hypothetical protein